DVMQIQRAADRAAAVARQLLSYSRRAAQQARAIPLDQALGDLLPMVARVLGEQRQVVTRFRCPESISIDVGHLDQMVTNLVLNARDAMPPGGTLTLST